MKPTPDRPAVGIRRIKQGWQAYVRIRKAFLSKVFPPATAILTMKDWREQQKARVVLDLPVGRKTGPTFADDAATYLTTIGGMASFNDRQYRIDQWVKALGGAMPRQKITAVMVRQQLERWRLSGLSNASLNLRRTALANLWTVLDGRGAVNPVRDVPKFREVPPKLVLPTLAEAEAALASVRADRKVSATRARLQVLLWTGLPSAQLKRLTKDDLDLKRKRLYVRGRRKGAGTRDRWLPLLPQAVKALRAFVKAKAFGPFSNSSLHSSLHRGCHAAHVRPFRPYDLRHLFGSTVAAATKDDRVVAELLQHADIRMTRRYTEQSVDARLIAGLDATRDFIAQSCNATPPQFSQGVRRHRSARKRAISQRSKIAK